MDVVDEYVRITTQLHEMTTAIRTLKDTLVPVEQRLMRKLRTTNGHFIIHNEVDRPMKLRLTKITKRPNLDRKTLKAILSDYFTLRFTETQSPEKIHDFSEETCAHIWNARKKKDKFKICNTVIKCKLDIPIPCEEDV